MRAASRFVNDTKKILDILFIMIGLGLITRISKNKFVNCVSAGIFLDVYFALYNSNKS